MAKGWGKVDWHHASDVYFVAFYERLLAALSYVKPSSFNENSQSSRAFGKEPLCFFVQLLIFAALVSSGKYAFADGPSHQNASLQYQGALQSSSPHLGHGVQKLAKNQSPHSDAPYVLHVSSVGSRSFNVEETNELHLRSDNPGDYGLETSINPGAHGSQDLGSSTQAAWIENAVAVNAPATKPWIAIVIDDLGLNQHNARRAINMPGPLTLSFMTYANDLPRLAEDARRRGHEVMLHLPMEPIDLQHNNPGKNALMVNLPPAELQRRIEWGLSRFNGFVGVNNHMGSRFTQNRPGMELVAAALKQRGLMFLDSRTSGRSIAGSVAKEAGLPVASRDVFLDHEPRPDFVRDQLKELERIAARRGFAVGIGHPHGFTLSILEEWMSQAEEDGFVIVPLTAIIKRGGQLG
jgi:polysaccharide deacetylase 2 family uncharacterized protein YibQ